MFSALLALGVQGQEAGRFVIEAKAPGPGQPIRLSECVRESVEEAAHYAQARNLKDSPLPIVVIKAPGKTTDQAYVVMRLSDFLEENR